jgi:hypothetical protein
MINLIDRRIYCSDCSPHSLCAVKRAEEHPCDNPELEFDWNGSLHWRNISRTCERHENSLGDSGPQRKETVFQ